MTPLGRAGTALLLAALACACRRAPPSLRRLDLGDETHGHRYDAKSGRLLYLQGLYPHKTYFCAYDVSSGEVLRSHFDDYRLIESEYAYLPESDEAVVAGLYKPAEQSSDHVYLPDARGGLMNFRSQEGAVFIADRLLHVSMKTGEILKEIPLAKDTSLLAIARPAGSKKVLIVLKSGEHALLKAYDPSARTAEDAVLMGDFSPRNALVLDAGPSVLLDIQDAAKKPRLVVYDVGERKEARSLARPSGFDELQAAGGTVLGRYSPLGEVKSVVAAIDPAEPAVRDLAVVEGGGESMLAAGGSLWVIGPDSSRPREANDRGFSPRRLTKIARDGKTPAENLPWTKRRGRLLGYDAAGARVLFAATEPASVWSIPADKEALASAAAELDRRAGEFMGRQVLLQGFLIVGIAVMGGLVFIARNREP